METHRLELYNLYERIAPDSRRERGPFNAWYVARLVDGRRAGHVDFGRDEAGARAYLATVPA